MRRTKNTTMKRITSVLLSAIMLLSSVQSVFAVTVESFTDFPAGWSRPAMESAVDNGLLVGFENNEIRPRNNLTRAEMAAIMARAFGAITMADVSAYTDVAYDAWYYEYIAKAVQMGAMTGKSATEMCPDCNITREEAFSVIGRILALSDEDTTVLSKFNDAANVSSWAVGNIAALVRRGYVNGDDLGNLNPKANITREEFAQVMYTTIKRYITEAGTYSEAMQGIVVLRTGNVNLVNMAVNGDLVVGDGAMKLAVKLEGVTVNGRFLTRGGTMTLKNTTVADGVVVLNPNGITHFNNYRNESVFAGINEITRASFLSGATIQTGGSSGGGSVVRHYVTFKLDDDDTEAYASIRIPRGRRIGSDMPDDPEMVGYTFEGWYDENGEEVTADTVVTGALNVTARFTLTEYDIAFKNEDGTAFSYFIDGYLPENKFNIEDPYTLPDSSKIHRPGYSFVGWVDAEGNPVTVVTVTEDTPDAGIVLYADFIPVEYTLKFVADFKNGDTERTVTYTIENYEDVEFPGEDDLVIPAGKESLIGWFTEAGVQVDVLDESFITEEPGVIVLTPRFTDEGVIPPPTSYDVIFKLDEDATDNYAEFAVVEGNAIGSQMPANPSILGYTFEGWFDDAGVEVTENTEVNSDITAIARFTAIEYTLRFEAEFTDGSSYKEVTYTIENYDSVVFPGGNELVIPDGKEAFLGWYLGDDKIEALDESFITDVAGTITLTPKFSDETITPTPPPEEDEYVVTFKLNAGDTDNYAEFTVVDGNTIDSQMPADPSKTGYSFDGWFDGSTEITADTVVSGEINAVAKFTLIEYPITYKVIDGSDFTYFVGTYRPEATYNIEEDYELPPADMVYRKGYTFNGWVDADGNPAVVEVTDETTAEGMTVYADFTAIPYTLRFEAEFTDGSSYKEVTYTIENYGSVVFPAGDELVIPVGKEAFLGWYTEAGDEVTALDESFITDEPGTIILVAEFTDEETIKVTFYRGHGDYAFKLGESNLVLNSEGVATMTEDKMPSYPQAVTEVFKKNKYMPENYLNLYPDDEEVLKVTPTFWYEVNGKLVPFAAPIELTQDTDVHLMYQSFALNANITDLPAAAISAQYNEDTRLLDSAKVLGDGAVNWLNQAKAFPKYQEIADLGIGALVDRDIMDENRNLKMMYIPISISAFTDAGVANGMVKTRIRELITDETRHDELLEIVDLNDLIDYVDKDAVINDLTDEQIAELMKAAENRAMVTSFIISDLQKSNSVLMDTVLDYISSSLATDTSLRDKLAAELKVKLAGSDATARKLRELILKSDSLATLLANDAIKAEVIDLIIDTDNGIIDELFKDPVLAAELIEEISHYPSFVDEIVKTDEFKNYVLPLIQVGGAEYDNVTMAILNSDVAKREILNAVEKNEEFKELLRTNATLRNEILTSITVDEEDILKYMFAIDGAGDYSHIISQADIDAYFSGVPAFDLMVVQLGSEKAAKNALYEDTDVRAAAAAEIAASIAAYKEKVLDDFIAGTLTDANILNMIETKMIDFVKRYVDKDTTLNATVASIIEEDILAYISALITGPVPADADLADVKARLEADMDAFIANAHNNPQIVQVIKNFVDAHNDDEMVQIISGIYADLVPTMATYIKGLAADSANYAAIDSALASAASTIDVAIISGFIKDNSTNPDILAILEEYIADPDNEDDIESYVGTFIDTIDAGFVRENRTLINELLMSFDLKELIGDDPDTIVQLVKDYISSMSESEKIAFADSIYNSISSTEEYKTLIEHIFELDEIVITDEDIAVVTALSYAIRALTIDEAIEFTHNSYVERLIDLIGKDFITERFNETRDRYCDGLDAAIEKVASGASEYETYTTSLSFRINPIEDVLIKLYDKALPIAEEKLMNANIYYEDNEYLQYIVEHDVIDRLVTGDGVINGEFIGYAIKDEADYAKYVMEMLIAADDALCWYGDEENLTEEQVDVIYDAVVLKAQIVHEKINELLEEYMATGELPEKAQQVLDNVQRLNDLFVKYESKIREVIDRYLAHSINDKIQDGSIAEDERVLTSVDILLGREDPVFTIDCLYDIFYQYDDKLQAKLKELVDSGKLEAAIDKALEKAKSTDAITNRVDAEKFEKLEKLADELYAILVNIANNGIDQYKVNTDNVATIIDQYELNLGENVFTMTRSLQ